MSTPEVFFRETIDINRYGNAVAEKYVRTYNEIILNAAKKLRSIDERQVAEIARGGARIIAPQTRKRLRAIIKQSSDSLNTWWARSALDMKKELQGVAQLQSEFIVNELKKVTETGGIPINSVAISEKYADSVIMTDPSEVNIFTSKQFTEDSFKEFGRGKFRLTATQGASITLPNGQTVQKAFRGIAESSAEKLDLAVRSGVFSGETLQQISRRLVGRLDFSQKGNVKQIAAAGGELTKLANHQIQTIVRTSVNQVTNQASMAVYAANKKVSPRYEYVATLDSRTSPICQRLDGQTFEYNNGPTPPQHFNCRSTTVPVVDFDGLQKKYPNLEKPPATQFDTRPSATGRVPQGTAYGDWLYSQRIGKFKPSEIQIETLGSVEKAAFFNRLAAKAGSGQTAIRQIVRNDGQKRSLAYLRDKYGKPSDIITDTARKAVAATPKPTPTPKPEPKRKPITGSTAVASETLEKYLQDSYGTTVQQFVDDSLDGLEAVGGRNKTNTKKLRKFMDKSRLFNNLNLRGDTLNTNKLFERVVVQNRAAFDASLNTTEKFVDKFSTNYQDALMKAKMKLQVKSLRAKSLASSRFRDDFEGYFRPAGGGNDGYTSILGTNVQTQVRTGSSRITKANALKIKEKTNELLKQNKAYADYWKKGDYSAPSPKREFFVTGENVGEDLEWITTMIHEIGHQVHFKGSGADVLGNKYRKLGGMKYVTGYSRKNPRELFAESFTCYVLDPDGLQDIAPRLYTWVEETLDNALKLL